MPFESRWSKIPLRVRWAVSFAVAIAAVVLLVRFVESQGNSSLVKVSSRNLRIESRQADIVIGEDQAPVTLRVPAGHSASSVLMAGVRRDMTHRITTATIDGPLGRVACGEAGHRGGRVAYHCTAEAGHVGYPFVGVATARTHRVVFCKKDFPPLPSENIPVSASCEL